MRTGRLIGTNLRGALSSRCNGGSEEINKSFVFQASRGSDLGDHVAAVKPNGGRAPSADANLSHANAASGGFEEVIHSMAQVLP